MKKILLFAALFIAYCSYGQLDSTRFQKIKSYYRWTGGWFDTAFVLPKDVADTVFNKIEGSMSYINGIIYYKNSTKWIAIAGGVTTADNGLTNNSGTVQLGGTLNQNTYIDGGGYRMFYDYLSQFKLGHGDSTNMPAPSRFLSTLSSTQSSDADINGIFRSNQLNSTTGSIQGVEGYTKTSHSSGTVNTAIGTIGNVEVGGAGGVTEARGMQAVVVITGNGNVGNAKSLFVSPPTFTANTSSTIDSSFGVYIGSHNSTGTGTVTNKFNIFTADGLGKNYFKGSTYIVDGTQGASKILTSDANGLASWQTPASSGGYTFSTGLTNSASTITSNLSTGIAGGQSVIGGTASGENLTYSSTSNATKGNHIFGTTTKMLFDETNGRLGLGIATPTSVFHLVDNAVTTGISSALSSTSLTTGNIQRITSTSTVVNGGSLSSIVASGANSTSSKIVVGQNISVTNTGTTSTNVGLNVTASGATNNYAAILTGYVGINTIPAVELDVAGRFKLVDGSEGLGKVLGSNAFGLASWQTPTSITAGTYLTGGVITTTGNVGVGTELTALAQFSQGGGNLGLSAKTAANTFTNRTIIGTYPIVVTDGSGATANPTISIDGGIFSLNTLTGSTQTFATATTGTDVNISSSGTVHTFSLPTASAVNRGALSSADWSTFNGKQAALTLSTGLTNSANTITANLSTGIAGGQSVIGGTASGENLTYSSTSNATKGNHIFGTTTKMIFNETNGQLGLGVATPAASSIVDITSTTKGFLMPRMTTTQRDAISSPATGLQVYNTTTNTINTYNGVYWATPNTLFSTMITAQTVNAGVSTYSFATGSTSTFSSTEANRQMIMPTAGKLALLYVRTTTAQPADGSCVITIRKNGVATALTLTIAANSAAATFTDLTDVVTFAAGDLISCQFTNNSASASATFNQLSFIVIP